MTINYFLHILKTDNDFLLRNLSHVYFEQVVVIFRPCFKSAINSAVVHSTVGCTDSEQVILVFGLERLAHFCIKLSLDYIYKDFESRIWLWTRISCFKIV